MNNTVQKKAYRCYFNNTMHIWITSCMILILYLWRKNVIRHHLYFSIDGLINLAMVIISQYICILNHHGIHSDQKQFLFVNYISKKLIKCLIQYEFQLITVRELKFYFFTFLSLYYHHFFSIIKICTVPPALETHNPKQA